MANINFKNDITLYEKMLMGSLKNDDTNRDWYDMVKSSIESLYRLGNLNIDEFDLYCSQIGDNIKIPNNYIMNKLEFLMRNQNSDNINAQIIFDLLTNDKFDSVVKTGAELDIDTISILCHLIILNVTNKSNILNIIDIIDDDNLDMDRKINKIHDIIEKDLNNIFSSVQVTDAVHKFKSIMFTLSVLDILDVIITSDPNIVGMDLKNITNVKYYTKEVDLEKLSVYLLNMLLSKNYAEINNNIHTNVYNCITRVNMKYDNSKDMYDILYESGIISDMDETHEIKYRDDEIKFIKTILNKKWINNMILIGEPGVGKTELIKYINQDIDNNFKIVNFKIHPPAINMVVEMFKNMLINNNSLSDFIDIDVNNINKLSNETLFEYIIRYIEKKHNIKLILFIDEIHKYLKNKDTGDYLKPILTREYIKIIGCTTYKEYDSYIAGDVALSRRFESLYINPLDDAQTIDILSSIIKPIIEDKHGVKIDNDVIEILVGLTNKYYRLSKFKNPALSINVLDITASHCSNENIKIMSEMDIKYILSKLTNITIDSMYINTDKDTIFNKIKDIENIIRSRIKGQDTAVNIVLRNIKKYLLGLHDKNKPIGVFLFLGPTGVGKTELAKSIAESLFGSEDNIIRLDMSEFKMSHSIEKLWGSPPGYVGHGEGGILSNEIRKKPNSVILLDEFEKAAKNVQDAFLHIFDDARMRDGRGNEYDFSNTVIIMTSNLFSDVISKGEYDYTKIKKYIKSNISKVMRPEFINRIDNMIIFNKLNTDVAKSIAFSKLIIMSESFKSKGYDIKMDIDKVSEYIAEYKYDKNMGGRSINRYIFNTLQGVITDKIIDNNLLSGSIKIFINDNNKLNIEL